jgi:TIR domain-containing protein
MARCFVSYTAIDEPWADWIGATLSEAGHDVSLQCVDFRPGENFVVRMQEAAAAADHTVVVLSNRYLASGFATAEWAAAFASDPTGENRALIPVAIEPVTPTYVGRPEPRRQCLGSCPRRPRTTVRPANFLNT